MKRVHWISLGSAIAGCAAAVGISLVTREAPGRGTTPQASESGRHRTADTTTRPGRSATSHEMSAGFRIQGTPPTNPGTDEREWFAKAERIEREANRELATLRETLDLSPHQERQIFDILARNSPSWMPGMATSSQPAAPTGSVIGPPGTPADALADAILPVLDADQQQALIEEELNRRAWWEEILPQLLPPEFPAPGAPEDPAAGLPGAGDTKEYDGPTELLEE